MTQTRDALWRGRVGLWQPDRGHGYRFNLDPVLLSGFFSGGGHVLDLGTGCGVLGILLLRSGKARRVTAVEIQPELAELARRNAVDNGLGDVFEVVVGDLREVELPTVDAAVLNPPYFSAGSGRGSPNPGRDAARHERHGTLDDFIAVAARQVAGMGPVAAVLPAARHGDLDGALGRCSLGGQRWRWVRPRVATPRHLVMVEARSGARELCQEPDLVVHDEAGGFLEEVRGWVEGPDGAGEAGS